MWLFSRLVKAIKWLKKVSHVLNHSNISSNFLEISCLFIVSRPWPLVAIAPGINWNAYYIGYGKNKYFHTASLVYCANINLNTLNGYIVCSIIILRGFVYGHLIHIIFMTPLLLGRNLDPPTPNYYYLLSGSQKFRKQCWMSYIMS